MTVRGFILFLLPILAFAVIACGAEGADPGATETITPGPGDSGASESPAGTKEAPPASIPPTTAPQGHHNCGTAHPHRISN